MKRKNKILDLLNNYKETKTRGREKVVFEKLIVEIKREVDKMMLYSYQNINFSLFNYNRMLEDFEFLFKNNKKIYLHTLKPVFPENKTISVMALENRDELNTIFSKLQNELEKNEGFLGLYYYEGLIHVIIEEEKNSKKMSRQLTNLKIKNLEFNNVYSKLSKRFSKFNKSLLSVVSKNEKLLIKKQEE